MKNKLLGLMVLTLLGAGPSQLSILHAQGTAFTYQGRLSDGTNAANGGYDLAFTLYDAATGPRRIGGTITNAATALRNGLFSVALDFGNQFSGPNRWLEMAVRTNGNGAFTTLTPRQQITATPYAVYSANAGSATTAGSAGSVSAANITGTLAASQLPAGVITNGASGVNISGTFTGNGAGLTGMDLQQINTGGAITYLYHYLGFVLSSSPTVGSAPISVTAADVNGDGKMDLICANYYGGNLTVLTNNGSGGFGLSSSPTVGSYPDSVTAADVNGDAKVDLICANYSSGNLTVLTNNGSGGFGLSSSPVVASSPVCVITADVNGDGKVDLIVANNDFEGNVTILTNNGSGGFALAPSPQATNYLSGVTAADVNGDGKVDLIVANYNAHKVKVLTNNGSGIFVFASQWDVGLRPNAFTAADVNGDGKPDLISANYDDATLTVLTNNGSGGFALAATLGVGNNPYWVTAADVNGDGKLDLISVNYGAATLTVLTNDGRGGFGLDSTPGVGIYPRSVVAADVNGDGRPDLICANFGSGTLTVLTNSSYRTASFNGNGGGLTGLNTSNLVGTLGPGNIGAGTITGAMLADGTVGSAQLQSGAALQNILAGGSASVAPGGVVMSDDPTNASLAAQGYVRMPNAEMTLAAEKWTKLNPPAANAEFISGHYRELSVNSGSELIVFRFDPTINNYYTMSLVEVMRYNPTTGQWSQGAVPPQDVVGQGCTAVWTGSQVILWGGEETPIINTDEGPQAVQYVNTTNVLVYTPASDQWTAIAGTGAIPQGRRLHSAVWTGSRMVVWGGEGIVDRVFDSVFWGVDHTYIREDLNTGAAFDPASGAWTALSTHGAPSPRRGQAGVWTGSRMLIQGGTQNNREPFIGDYHVELYATNVFHDGASYNPANDTWAPIRSDGTSPAEAFAQAVWTGNEMVVYGGEYVYYVYSYDPNYLDPYYAYWDWVPYPIAYSYNPTNDWWTYRGSPDGTGPNMYGRTHGTLAWTGSEVIAFGGEGRAQVSWNHYARADAVAYNMTAGAWRTLPAGPLGGGADPLSAWIGDQWIVCDAPSFTYGFFGSPSPVNPIRAAYSPTANSWSVLPNYFGPAPLKQDDPSAVWTGQEFIIWGGPVNGIASNRGRRYHPATGAWTEISTTNAPAARMRHSAVWTGSRMVVWGGDAGGDPRYPAVIYATGGAYDPIADTWTTLPGAPFDPVVGDAIRRTGHKAVWTAYGMVVVGGSDGYNNQDENFPRTIARLSADLTTWTISPPSVTSSLGRFGHCLATDGDRRVFLWGGQSQTVQDPIGVGMLIDAFTLSVGFIDDADQPVPARNSSIVWSGKEFIVWGGTDPIGLPLGGGSKFNPAGGYWTPLSHGGPIMTTPHAGHTAVWSGTEMLLWGGTTNQFGERYNPRNDGWNPMTVGPVARLGAHGQWNGTNMLLYLPALPTQGAIPELWQYQPPSKIYYYLKQ